MSTMRFALQVIGGALVFAGATLGVMVGIAAIGAVLGVVP